MTGILEKFENFKFSGTIRYVLGAFLLLMSLAAFVSSFIAGLLFLLAAILTIPSSARLVEEKINVSIPGIAEFFIVFLLVGIACSALPTVPNATNNTTNNTEIIATPPSAINSNEVVTVPSEQTPVTMSNSTSNPANMSATAPTQTTSDAAIKNSASNPVNTPTTTSAPKAASTSATTPTQTFDNKGKLDVLTSPAGATITVDGVSEGVSPIEGLSVDAGAHSVTVYLSGYDPQREKVEISNSETKQLFYTLVPETDKSTASTSTPEETSTSEVTSTSTPETPSYQDAQWLTTCSPDAYAVADDMEDLSTAASNYDFTSLSTYAGALYTDSQRAIDNSDLYSVSPDLQGAKNEYRLGMVQANWAAIYTRMGVDEYNKGNVESGTSYLEQAAQCIESCGQHLKNSTKLLDDYNSKKS